MARNSDGCLEVVVNTLEGAAWHRWQRREGGWSGWDSFDDPPVKNMVAFFPTLVYNGDGRLELFTRGAMGRCGTAGSNVRRAGQRGPVNGA